MNLDPLARGIMAKAGADLAATEAENAYWSHYGWAAVRDEDGNCDQIPNHLLPKTGCPECGSVWTSFFAVGFQAERAPTGRFNPARWYVDPDSYPTKVTALRLLCAGGHAVEHDVNRTRVMVIPQWSSSLLLAGAAMLAGYLFTRSR